MVAGQAVGQMSLDSDYRERLSYTAFPETSVLLPKRPSSSNEASHRVHVESAHAMISIVKARIQIVTVVKKPTRRLETKDEISVESTFNIYKRHFIPWPNPAASAIKCSCLYLGR